MIGNLHETLHPHIQAEVPIVPADPNVDYLAGQTHVSKYQVHFNKEGTSVEVPIMQQDGSEAAVHVPAPAGLVITSPEDPSELFYVKTNGDVRPFSAWRPPKAVRLRREAAFGFHQERGDHGKLPDADNTTWSILQLGKAVMKKILALKPKRLPAEEAPTTPPDRQTRVARQASRLGNAAFGQRQAAAKHQAMNADTVLNLEDLTATTPLPRITEPRRGERPQVVTPDAIFQPGKVNALREGELTELLNAELGQLGTSIETALRRGEIAALAEACRALDHQLLRRAEAGDRQAIALKDRLEVFKAVITGRADVRDIDDVINSRYTSPRW